MANACHQAPWTGTPRLTATSSGHFCSLLLRGGELRQRCGCRAPPMGFPSEALEHAGVADDFVCKICAALVDYSASAASYTACTHGARARGCSRERGAARATSRRLSVRRAARRSCDEESVEERASATRHADATVCPQSSARRVWSNG